METTNVNATLRSTFKLLQWTFGILPIVAGLDKFFNILADWEKYLSPWLVDIVPFEPHTFMMIVGIIEIIAGIIVFAKPKIGGIVVAAWLALIALSLIIGWEYVDIAVRDLVMAIAAISMARLAGMVHEKGANLRQQV